MKVKEQVKREVSRAKRIIANGETFIQAVALTIVTVTSLIAVKQLHFQPVYKYVVIAGAAIVAIRAFVEYVKFLDRE